ncbi:MAG: hypothetical protein IIV19_03445 [Bacteroidaceae bacterium]|nr:hypothetical protein [Bacteroidaceae bacterium]
MRLFFIFILMILVAACTTTRIVPVETVRVDSVFVAKIERDSIYQRDSVFVAVKADTVFKTSLKYVYRDRIVRDTVSVLRLDTVAKVVEVEKRLSFWQQKKLELGGVAMWLIPLLAGIFIFLKR